MLLAERMAPSCASLLSGHYWSLWNTLKHVCYCAAMTHTYEYEVNGRRPVTWFPLAVFAFLFWIAWTQGAPWYIWTVWSVSCVMLLYLVVSNPRSGLRLTPETLVHWAGQRSATINLKEVDQVEIKEFSDSTYVVIHMTDGREETLLSGSVPSISVLESEFGMQGIKTVRT